MLFHDMGKPDTFTTDENGKDHFHGHASVSGQIAYRILKRLKFDNDTTQKVCTLVRHHSMYPQLSAREIRKGAYLMGPELYDSFLQVKRADIMAQHPDVIPNKLVYLDQVEHIWEDVKLHQDCLSLKQLRLTGKDLIGDGMKPGPDIGEVLEKLLLEVLDQPGRNTRDYLLEESRRLRTS